MNDGISKNLQEPVGAGQFIRLKQLAAQLGLPYKKLYNDVRSGKLKALKVGTWYYVHESNANEYVLALWCEANGKDLEQTKRELEGLKRLESEDRKELLNDMLKIIIGGK